MQIKCAKCSKILLIPDDKLPKDKDRMVIKCPACGQGLAFSLKGRTADEVHSRKSEDSQGKGSETLRATGADHEGNRQRIGDGVGESLENTGERTVVIGAAHGAYNPRIKALNGDSEFKLLQGDNIIGRSAGGSEPGRQFIQVPGDPFISGKHCLIRVSMQHGIPLCVISDDGSISSSGEPSTNGTFHNGNRLTRLEKICLTQSDTLRIGHTEFIFDV